MMSSLSRRLLQISAAISSAIAVLGGGLYLALGVAGLSIVTGAPIPVHQGDPTWAIVDYLFRALAGVWFILGLMLAFVIPSIEKHSAWFAFICAGIFAMGIGRLLSVAEFGFARQNSLVAMVTELLFPPILIIWQRSVARAHRLRQAAPQITQTAS